MPEFNQDLELETTSHTCPQKPQKPNNRAPILAHSRAGRESTEGDVQANIPFLSFPEKQSAVAAAAAAATATMMGVVVVEVAVFRI